MDGEYVMFGSKKNEVTLDEVDEKQYQNILDEARSISQALKIPMDTVWKLMMIQRLDKLNSRDE